MHISMHFFAILIEDYEVKLTRSNIKWPNLSIIYCCGISLTAEWEYMRCIREKTHPPPLLKLFCIIHFIRIPIKAITMVKPMPGGCINSLLHEPLVLTHPASVKMKTVGWILILSVRPLRTGVCMTALASHLSLLSLPIHLPLDFEGEICYSPSSFFFTAPKLSLLCYKTLLPRAWKY